MMRKLTYLILLLGGFFSVAAQSEELMVDGMRAYMKEDFGEAILVFEKLAKVRSQEPAVFYYLNNHPAVPRFHCLNKSVLCKKSYPDKRYQPRQQM